MFVSKINDQIVGKKYLLESSTDSINLGIFNHWLSVGPVELWNKREEYDINKIVKKIRARPEIENSTLNYQGLLFRFNTKGNLDGPYYGIKTPCCNKINGKWVIDFNKVDKWMKTILDIGSE